MHMRGVFLAHGAVTELYAREDLHLLVRNATIGYTGRRQGHGKSIGSIQRLYKDTHEEYRQTIQGTTCRQASDCRDIESKEQAG